MFFYTKLNVKLLHQLSIVCLFLLSLYVAFFSSGIEDIDFNIIFFLGIPILFHYIFNIILDLTTSLGVLSLCYGGSSVNKFLIKRIFNLILIYLLFCTIPHLVYFLKSFNVLDTFKNIGYTYLSILFMLAFTTIFFAVIKSGLSSLTISLVYFYLFELGLSKGFLGDYSLFSYFKGEYSMNITFFFSRVMYIILTIVFITLSINLISKDNKYKLSL